MAEQFPKIAAPQAPLGLLWGMKGEDFNDWRRKNDYPRIIKYFKDRVEDFNLWMDDQQVTDELLLKYSVSRFIRFEKVLFEYHVSETKGHEKVFISIKNVSIGSMFDTAYKVVNRKQIIPYYQWYKDHHKKDATHLFVNKYEGRNVYFNSELELLDLGNFILTNHFLAGDSRMLDFVNLCDLVLNNCIGMSRFNISYSAAENLTITGDFHFLSAYKTGFGKMYRQKINCLHLKDGDFQSWYLEDCDIHINVVNSNLTRWIYSGRSFSATLTTSDIQDCNFEGMPVKYPIYIGENKTFHAHVKRLYSLIGRRKEASEHYYKEKTFERRSFLHPRENHSDEFYKVKTPRERKLLMLRFKLSYLRSWFLNVLWGYGEKPHRVFFVSIATLLLFALLYCFNSHSIATTKYQFWNSLYYSMVTFTTLGFGDIAQTNTFLKVMSGVEAFLGMSFWGIMIAGFTSNSKDY